MKNTTRPRATAVDYEKRNEYNEMLNKKQRDSELNMEYLDFMNRFTWGAEIFMKEDKCGLKSGLGEILLPADFEDMKLLSQEEVSHGQKIVVMQKGKWGVVLADGEGTWLIEPEFDFIGYPNTLAAVCKNGKWGVLDLSKRDYLIPLECDRIHSDQGFMFTNRIGFYEKDGLTGVISDSGDFTEPVFEEVEFDSEEGAVKVKYNGQWGFVDEKHQVTTQEDDSSL